MQVFLYNGHKMGGGAEIAGVDNAGVDKDGGNYRGGFCRSGQYGKTRTHQEMR